MSSPWATNRGVNTGHPLAHALRWLVTNGYKVENTFPGLYRVNDGHELTEMQIVHFAWQESGGKSDGRVVASSR